MSIEQQFKADMGLGSIPENIFLELWRESIRQWDEECKLKWEFFQNNPGSNSNDWEIYLKNYYEKKNEAIH